jgi:hypothetical protein
MKTLKKSIEVAKSIQLIESILLFVFLMLAGKFSKAQLIYVDISPDITISNLGDFYDLDLNGDGIMDFEIIRDGVNIYKSVDIKRLHDSCSIAFYSLEVCFYAKMYANYQPIDNSSLWFNSDNNVNLGNYGGKTLCMHYGAFPGQVDKYLGLRLIVNGITYYGWVRIDVASNATWFKIKDYAYNDSSIIAGQGIISGINDKDYKVKLEILNFTNEIIIQSSDKSKIISAKLINPISQELYKISMTSDQAILNKRKLKPGIYIIIILTTTGNYTAKLLL